MMKTQITNIQNKRYDIKRQICCLKKGQTKEKNAGKIITKLSRSQSVSDRESSEMTSRRQRDDSR